MIATKTVSRLAMRAMRRPGIAALLCGLCAPMALAQTSASPVPEIYTCVDASGRKLTADRPIPACIDREQKILNASGTLRAKIGPTLTEQERMQAEAKRKAAEAEQARLEEERRKDKALLARYPNLARHEQERANALQQVQQTKQAAVTKLEALKLERKKIDAELEFYAGAPNKVPSKLLRSSSTVDQAIVDQTRFVEDQDKQIDRISANFDSELQRLQPMWRAAATSTPQ